MTENERDELLIAMSNQIKMQEKQLENRDKLLITLAKELALLRYTINTKFGESDKFLK